MIIKEIPLVENNDLSGKIEQDHYKEIIVCLFDGHYHLGAAAFINSVVACGFTGLIYVGYRGLLPPWVNLFGQLAEHQYNISPGVVAEFKEVDTFMHLGYYKPFFINDAFERFTLTNKFYYFDVDIIIKAPWTFYSEWLKNSPCLCLDNSFPFIHHTHPWRKQWKLLASPEEEIAQNNIDYYFNSGFLGIERKSSVLIDRWINLTERYKEIGGDLNRFIKNSYSSLKGDQDLLNAAITISPNIEVSIIGQEGMGFTYPVTLMEHAIGDDKPWKNRFIKQLIVSGHKPNAAEKSFFLHCDHPIHIFPNYKYRLKKYDLLISSFFGRVLG